MHFIISILSTNGAGVVSFVDPNTLGATGPQGPIGLTGPQGPAGADGTNGTNGNNGAVGATGPQGTPGNDGADGATGPQGPAGNDGQGGVTQAGREIAVSGTGTVGDPYIVSTSVYTIGLWPELGGYVFRVSADGRHGLVAETVNQSVSNTWYTAQDIISDPASHSTNGQKFMDWRMPTKYELNEMYEQKVSIGGFANAYYWSSTEYDTTNAWTQFFSNGSQLNYLKVFNSYVRSVRAF